MRSASPDLASRLTRVTVGLAIVSLSLSLAGCTRDLELPGIPTNPTLSGFTPTAAHAGQLIRVTGTHLDAEATANAVNFANATGRGERWEGSDLVVRVPADAGDGPITVSNRDGTSSASSSAFDYLGLGEPRRIQVASSSPILHRPRAVYAVGGDVVLHSSLYGGLVWAGSSTRASPLISISAAAAWQGTGGALYYVTGTPGTYALNRIDAATGLTQGPVTLPATFDPAQMVPLRGLDVLAVFGNDGTWDQVALFNLSDLTQRLGPTPYGVDAAFFSDAADVGDGRVVMAATDPLTYDFTLGILDVGAGLTGPLPDAVFMAPPPAGITSAPLAVGRAGAANVSMGIAANDHLAAVALYDGNVGVANLDATTPGFALTVETWSPSPIEAVAADPASGTVAVATKKADGLSIGFDLASGRALWSVAGNAPTVASADGSIAFVAHDGDNDVTVVNLATGSRVGRVNLDVLPGAAEFKGAAAFVPAASGIDGDVLFPSTAFPGLLRLPTSTGEPALVTRGTPIDFVDADLQSGDVWATASGATATVQGWSGGDWSASTSADLTGATAPRRTASRGTRLAVVHDAGLSLLEGGALLGTAAIPGAANPWFRGLGFTSSGDVWIVVDLDGGLGTQVQRWAPASIAAGGVPAATWIVPGTPLASGTVTVLAAAWLEDGLWIFWWDAGGQFATLVDESLTELRTVAASPDLTDIQAISPNGRLLVQREFGATLGYVLRFFRADPETGFPAVQLLVFPENVTGFAFDATGERLYVVTQKPDRVIAVD